MNPRLKILFLDDVGEDAELVERTLDQSGINFQSRIVETKIDYLKTPEKFLPDIITSDYSQPNFYLLTELKNVFERFPNNTIRTFPKLKIRREYE